MHRINIIGGHIIFALILFIFLNPYKLYSQTINRTITKNYRMENGLSSNRVYSIEQDSLGFIWFGTNDGLNRFDGVNFKKYHYVNGDKNCISSNSIRWLMISRDNKMWISLDNGVDIYNPVTDSFRHFDIATPEGEEINGRTLEIIEDRDGDIWIGTQDYGLYHYSPKKNILKVYRNIPGDKTSISQNWITTIFEDSHGTIWAGTYSEGLCAFSKETNTFTTYKKTANNSSLSDNSVQKIYEDSFGYLWIGTFQNGLDRFDHNAGTFTNFQNHGSENLLYHIHDIIEYRPGELLIASDNGIGVFNISEGNLSFNRKKNQQFLPVTNKFIYKIFKDREGSLWLGSYFEGIEYYPPIRDNFHYYSCETNKNLGIGKVVNAICEDEKGIFWIGTDDNGIHMYDAVSGDVKPFRTAADINSTYYCVHSLLVDNGKLFAATYERGLEVYDMKTKKMKSYLHDPNDSNSISSSRVFTLFKSSNGRIYIGTANGLCYYSREKDNFVHLKPEFRVASIVEDAHNNLWIATKDNGLYYYNIKNNEYKYYSFDINDNKSLIRNALLTLSYDSKGRLWVGSDGYGLCRYDEEADSFIRYDKLDLPNDIISKIIPDGDLLWISTNKGLVRWDVDNNQTKTYSKSSGLYNEQFSPGAGIMASNGKIFLGSADGFCTFSPYKLVENKYNPPVVFTSLSIYNRSITPHSENSPIKQSIETTRDIILDYNQSMIGIEFAALSYLDPEENLYQYILEGFDSEWHTANGQNRYISYTNLPSGEYTLRLRGTNSDKIWSTNEAVLNITVKPHFLKSRVAISLYVFCLALLSAFLIWYLLKISEKKHNKKIRLIERKTQQEAYESKIEFFTNIAHEIRTPLSLIIGPLEYVMRSRKINDKYGEYLSIIELNYRRLYALVTQLLDFRKVDSGNYKMKYTQCSISDLVTEVVSMFRMTAMQKGIEINMSVKPKDMQLVTDKEALTKIISNLISNAIKYCII